MNNRRLLSCFALICISTLIVSCSSSKKVGCYYGDDSNKELEIEKKLKTYSVAE